DNGFVEAVKLRFRAGDRGLEHAAHFKVSVAAQDVVQVIEDLSALELRKEAQASQVDAEDRDAGVHRPVVVPQDAPITTETDQQVGAVKCTGDIGLIIE